MPHANRIGALPLTTVQRLPDYLRLLRELETKGREFVSSSFIGARLNFEAIQVRKDFSHIGIAGKPRTGFRVASLIDRIERCLNWDNVTEAVLVGTGHLGTALLGYEGFDGHGLRLVAAFDSSPSVVGTKVHGRMVFAMDDLPRLVDRLKTRMAILTVPPEAAQPVADVLVGAGVQGIWNFTGRTISVPEDVIVQNQDISAGLAVLSAKLLERRRIRRRAAGAAVAEE